MMKRHPLPIRLLCACLIAAIMASAPPCRADPPTLAHIQVGNQVLTGIFLNKLGHLVVPAMAGEDNVWTVLYNGQEYRASVAEDASDYGIQILKIDTAEALSPTLLARRLVPGNAKLRLIGLDAAGKPVNRPVAGAILHRGLPDLNLTGQFYEITLLEEAPMPGAALVNADTGEVYGMLIKVAGQGGVRYVVRDETICDRVANRGFPLGAGEAAKPKSLAYADGNTAVAHSNLLPFNALSIDRANTTYAHAVQDFRKHTGFQVNNLTTPVLVGDNLYFGSSIGLVYCLDCRSMQSVWRFQCEHAVVFPPDVQGDFVCVSAGDLGFKTVTAHDQRFGNLVHSMIRDSALADLAANLMNGLVSKRIRRVMFDHGCVYCIDRHTGVMKWRYPALWLTRFLGEAHIVGDRVLVGGVNTLAVLNLADGKEVWATSSDRTEGNPVYYTVADGEGDKMWVLKINVRLDGENGSISNPLHLEQAAQAPEVQCYSLTELEGDEDRSAKGGAGKRAAGGEGKHSGGDRGNHAEGGRDRHPNAPMDRFMLGKHGKLLWSTPITMPHGAPPLSATLIMSPDHRVCYGATSKEVFAVDAGTGKLLWQHKVFTDSFDGNIAYADSLLFATGSENRLYALSAISGDPLWDFAESKNRLCAPTVYQGKVYVGSHDTSVYALDARTGKWVWKYETGGKVCGQPCIIDNKLYCTTDDGRLTELDLP